MRRQVSFKVLLMTVCACVGTATLDAQQPAANRLAAPHRLASRNDAVATPHVPVVPDLATILRSGRAQAVRFSLPPDTTGEIATSAGILPLEGDTKLVIAVGPTYRLRLSTTLTNSRVTVYPTMRLIGYTVPPSNVDPTEHPVPIHFEPRDLSEATDGRHVINVIYLEDPLLALPMAFPRGEVPVLDLAPGEDVLFKASAMGRPIAFIQLGNRVPLDDQLETSPNDPPVIVLTSAPAGAAPAPNASAIQPAGLQLAAPLAGAAAASWSHGSRPLCATDQQIIRQPYKVHPRMPRDEYLTDGGDQIPLVHFDADDSLTGLAQTETVAQFRRPGERPRVVASNEVAVYAPRFGLLRSSAASLAGFQIEGARGVGQQLRRGAVETRIAIDQRTQQKQVRALRQRLRPSGLAMNEPLAGLDELRVIDGVHQREGSDKLAGPIGPNTFGQADELRLAKSIDAAREWNRQQYPAFTAIIEGGGMITGTARTGEVDKITEPTRRPGDLILFKTATPAQAQQGDVVEFAIYYRNVGERLVESVSIIDSLTARLEYVPNSAKTDRRAVFTAAQNDVESHELRWDISDPIPAGQGGVVWFEAKVR